jgi:hypothetical protein
MMHSKEPTWEVRVGRILEDGKLKIEEGKVLNFPGESSDFCA